MPPVSETELGVGDGGGGAADLSQADCVCPICLEIFLEPVTLPCTHTFCKPCFLETVDKSNLCCPLCRRRVSTWARLHSRNKTLVNVELWGRLQEAFPAQCQRRLCGQDAEDTATVASRPRVCQPGELRREYEDQISKLAEEKRALEEAECRASEDYIQRLLMEEEERQAEERRTLEETQLEEDERLARLLSLELNASPMSESQRNARPADVVSTMMMKKKKKKSSTGDMERFLFPVAQRSPSSTETSPSSCLTANKENILMPLSPGAKEEHAEPPMPTLDSHGKELGFRPHQDAAEALPPDAPCTQAEQGGDGWSPGVSQTRGRASGKRKSGDTEDGWGCGLDSKRPRTPANGAADPPLLWELAQEEEDLFSRRQQEESDRQLALRLQRQLDREEAQRAVDRSKGSPDQYLLRDKPEPAHSDTSAGGVGSRASRRQPSSALPQQVEKKGRKVSHKTSGASTSITNTTPSSTATALKKSSKQATLKELFHSLAS